MKKHSTFKEAIKEVATPIDERRFTNIHNRIKITQKNLNLFDYFQISSNIK